MSLTREDMLRELELLPAWHLRQPLPTPAASLEAAHAAPVESPASTTLPSPEAQHAAEPAAATLPTPASEEVLTAEPVSAAAITPVSAMDNGAVSPVNADATSHAAYVLPDADTAVAAGVAAETTTADTNTADDALTTSPPWDDDIPPPDEMLLPIFDDDDHLPDMATSLGQGRRDSIAQLDWQGLQSCVANCQACSLSRTRTQTVFGVGDPAAEWLIVGEAPGAEEDKRGEPFVGQAGQLLDNMLGAIQLKRGQNVYIANVLKCRPPQNRDPQGEEVQQCDPFLKRQVELIKPKLILALGKFAAQSLLNSDATIGSMRGRQHEYNGVPVIVTYHPAYLLRNLMDKAKAWEDLCLARATMRKLQEDALQSAAAPSSKD
ncbi:uracil-DNA glycosylase [Methylovorus glucosotrophus]|uniref:Type-4 uracil-DNA glycosylase n=1 Tax=Methylovorus glucosotrophus (strain SIP3-4) TaxID=582744 RepID=C6X9Y5_METGS|nr:uracil-DNA glycosylase [Methylovorus glucosotrophus]ACT51526.1 phage SPO1 DNA polymerase-related protein [Methylovorus glucosotrophus SIP3-4]